MTLIKYKYTWILYLMIICQACGPGRTVSESAVPQPHWVKSRPVTPGYYTGIGWAKKTTDVYQYQQTARQNALADLAGEISVTISSSSVLHAFESGLGFREDFSTTIEARTREELQEFEIIDTWEDQHNYWVYYRLSADRHREIKEKRRNDAVMRSLGFYENAIKSREEGQIRNNLVQLINSLEAIKNYFDDPLPVEFRGRNIQLGNDIYNELSSSVSQITIIPSQPQIEIKTGQKIPSSLLKFSVASNTGDPVAGFPLIANYSEKPLRNNRARTDRDGTALFSIDVVISSMATETFTVLPDMEALLAEATNDPFIRRLIGRFSLPEAEIRINTLPPVIMMISREENIGEELLSGTLRDNFRRNAIESGYIISNNRSEADYIVRITATTSPRSEAGAYKNAVLNGNISVETADGQMIYHRELEGFRGSHFDFSRAGEEAFRQAAGRMESSFFREIDEALKSRPSGGKELFRK